MKTLLCTARSCRWALVAAAALAGSLLSAQVPAGAIVVFSDSEFLDSDWVAAKVGDNTPGMNGTFSAQQDLSVGNQRPSRRVNATWTADPRIGNPSQGISILHRRPADVYDPAIQGAISSFDVEIDGFAGYSIQINVIQDGFLYEGRPSNFPGSPNGFTAFSASGLVPSDYVCFTGCPGILDFSASGSPISFGFQTSGSTMGFGVRNRVGWVDNWRVTIHTVNAVPEPAGLLIFSMGLFGLAAALRGRGRLSATLTQSRPT